MKKLYLLLLCGLAMACHVVKDVDCGGVICTQEYRSIQVQFVNSEGEPLEVKDFSSINQRTGKIMSKGKDGNLAGTQGYYVVAADGNLKDFASEGDVVVVSATNPFNGETEKIEFQVTGGVCNCHVYKVTGPDKFEMAP